MFTNIQDYKIWELESLVRSMNKEEKKGNKIMSNTGIDNTGNLSYKASLKSFSRIHTRELAYSKSFI